MENVRLWEAPPLPFREAEILRYASLPPGQEAPEGLPLTECLRAAEGIRCRCVWADFPVKKEADGLNLGFARTGSRSLMKFLAGTERIILFAMTAGRAMDMRIAAERVRSPLRGLLAHAIGAERVETACDAFCEEIPRLLPGWEADGRFSPGYGDWPLETQKAVFRALDCGRRLGMSLNPETLLMTPSKSVTAAVRLRRTKTVKPDRKEEAI